MPSALHTGWHFDRANSRLDYYYQGTRVGHIGTGGLTVATGGLTVDTGGITVTAGGLTVTAGGLTVTAGGLTITAGALSTEGDIDLADGGTVTQITSITTGVTLNTHSGQITTVSSTLAAGAEATFTVTNSKVAATDIVIAHLASTSSAGTPVAVVSAVAAGSFNITIANLHASAALDNTMVINFGVIGGSAT